MKIKIQVKNQFDCSCNILERHTTNYEKHILRDMRNAIVEKQWKGQEVQSFWLAGRQVVVNYGNTYSRKMSFKILKEQSSQKYRRESPRFKNFEFAPPLKRPLLRHILAHSPLS